MSPSETSDIFADTLCAPSSGALCLAHVTLLTPWRLIRHLSTTFECGLQVLLPNPFWSACIYSPGKSYLWSWLPLLANWSWLSLLAEPVSGPHISSKLLSSCPFVHRTLPLDFPQYDFLKLRKTIIFSQNLIIFSNIRNLPPLSQNPSGVSWSHVEYSPCTPASLHSDLASPLPTVAVPCFLLPLFFFSSFALCCNHLPFVKSMNIYSTSKIQFTSCLFCNHPTSSWI